MANFFWLRSILTRSLGLDARTAPRFAVLRYLVRLALMAVAVYVLVVYCRADLLGLLLGLSVLVFNIIAVSIYMISTQGE